MKFFRYFPFVLVLLLAACEDSSVEDPVDPVVDPVTQAPTCFLVTPSNNAMIALGDSVPLKVESAYPDKKAVSVTFTVDNKEIATSEDLQAVWVPEGAILGRHVLRASTTYDDGTVGTKLINMNVVARVAPELYSYSVIKKYPHNKNAYTQGLIYADGLMYESTGIKKESDLRKVDLNSGQIMQISKLEDQYFGEGITMLNDKIYMLTWESKKGFVYDKYSLTLEREFSYSGQGWGLTNDGTHLLMSDGTSAIRFVDPQSLREVHRIEIGDQNGPQTNLNELEYINGEIWANVYQSDVIIAINPSTGEVTKKISFSNLLTPQERQGTDVLNGIAYDEETKKLFVTGKYWPSLFQVEIVPLETP